MSWAVDSSPGRVWQAIRENEQRVAVLGMQPVPLQADGVRAGVVPRDCRRASSTLLLIARADPSVTTPSFTLALLLMVVIGGTGTRWGAVLGAVALHVPRPPAARLVEQARGPGSARRAEQAAVAAALRARHAVHPARVLPARRARRPRAARAAARRARDARAGGRPRRHARRRAGGRASVSAPMSDVQIAWEALGDGPPLLLVMGLGYDRHGWGPLPGCSPRTSASSSTTTAGSARATCRRARTRPRRWPAMPLAVLDAAGIDRAHVRRHEPRRDGRAGARARRARSASTSSCSRARRRAGRRVPDAAAHARR